MGQTTSLQNQQNANHPEVSWWLRFGARALGTISSLLAMALGVWACVTFTPKCIAAGMLQIVAGFVVCLFEAPCCCQFLDFIQNISEFADKRPYWNKAILYCALAIIPVALCPELTTLFGAGSIFVSGALYGLMALGKKADRDTMMSRVSTQDDDDMKLTLVENQESETTLNMQK
ncbi:calcium channel flower-like [Lineus longissimus]|uniref:calcium channel flower-like n=1 Tax=Lineus longissimus TaxID=88925 RepID=UPI002B4D852C